MGSVDEEIATFRRDIKKGNSLTSYEIALKTVNILRKVISEYRWANARELMEEMKEKGKNMMSVASNQSTIGNMVRKVLKIVREEHARCLEEDDNTIEPVREESLTKLYLLKSEDTFSRPVENLRTNMYEALTDLISELETSREDIINQAAEHIHSNEVVLTFGYSSIVLAFFKKARKQIEFQVIVVEDAPKFNGQKMAAELAQSKIKTTVINDSAAFSIMARVNKVFIGTHAIMADGGLKAKCGIHNIALAAKRHSVPVIVCAALYKLSPEFFTSHDQSSFNKLGCPQEVLNFAECGIPSDVQVYNPIYDYVPPDLVTLIISNMLLDKFKSKTFSEEEMPQHTYIDF
ncbi:DgyrCDS7382 [Dimorphilus gyrociliatus]|uniref:Translation initiation factor eIF2B subunit beta n=1 Tax=Dimorphilus gyrociliatus TaxID=2664684 RepID=A0A7I8VTH2_9ANNE|nr:DgyrCDS7382 [Dimorphilus gyrociliatus]